MLAFFITNFLSNRFNRGSTPWEGTQQIPTDMIKQIIEKWRSDNAKADAERLFNATVYHCARVSRANPSIAFEIKYGELGTDNPKIIDRPDVVVLQEDEEKVIVRDGIVWSITRERP